MKKIFQAIRVFFTDIFKDDPKAKREQQLLAALKNRCERFLVDKTVISDKKLLDLKKRVEIHKYHGVYSYPLYDDCFGAFVVFNFFNIGDSNIWSEYLNEINKELKSRELC